MFIIVYPQWVKLRLVLYLPQMAVAKFMDVQMQCGESDCGLFSIAFTTALVFGEPPGHILFD